MSLKVRDLIRNRFDSSSRRESRSDPFHLALVIEGGGMRGVVAGGMVTAIQDLQLFECFDTIHGSSAGACAGAYLTAGQAAVGTSIYYEDINNNKFINVARGLLGRPIMSADFLIDHVMHHVKPLDTKRIVRTKGFLHIVTTAVADAQPRVFSEWPDEEAFFNTLRASIKMPIIAGRSVVVDGQQYVDGGVVQQIALQSALRRGATHVLVLMTRKQGELERKSTPWVHSIESSLLRHAYGGPIAMAYERRNPGINSIVKQVSEGSLENGVQCDSVVRAHDAIDVGRLTKNEASLRIAAEEGRQAVANYIGMH